MGRKRIHANAAERQKAYRSRESSPGLGPVQSQRKGRPPPRPKRLAAFERGIRDFLAEFEDWQDQLPESLRNSPQGEKLTDAIDKLTAVADLLADIELPLGFGRD